MANTIFNIKPSIVIVTTFVLLLHLTYIETRFEGEDVTDKKDWKKKDIRDYR